MNNRLPPVEYYTASSVIEAVRACTRLHIQDLTSCPKGNCISCPKWNSISCPKWNSISCPKENNTFCPKWNSDCSKFPDCWGEKIECKQTLIVVSGREATREFRYIVKFFYYVDATLKDGRIKKNDEMLNMLARNHKIDRSFFKSV